MKPLIWRTEKRKVKDLKLFDGNPRKMSKEEAHQLMKSIKKFNLVEIPAIDLDNRVIAGNQRVQALITLGRGDEEIEVRVPNRKLTEREAKEYLLRSNKNTGSWDFSLLKNFEPEFLSEIGWDVLDLEIIFGRNFTQGGSSSEERSGDGIQKSEVNQSEGDVKGKEQIEGEREIDVNDLRFTHKCPRCGYEW